ncbi:hypothetical protein ABKN59_001109 [Abortiporus biennis]
MVSGILTVPTPTWHPNVVDRAFTTSTAPFTKPILPVVTPAPTSSCTTNVLVVISTTIDIPDYYRFYQAPIQDFKPTYYNLPDGSLVGRPLIDDIREANAWLVLIGAMLLFFFTNTIVAVRYVRKGLVKRKGLFYLLLASQLLGVIGSTATLIPFFNQYVSCTAVGFVSQICTVTSYGLLMTGILGIKAYRCLDNSRYVLVLLTGFRTSMIALLVLDLTKYHGIRRLSGSCAARDESKIIPSLLIIQCVESFVICVCFLIAVIRASRKRMDRGRLSIQVSLESQRDEKAMSGGSADSNVRRGWWDYVPDGETERFKRNHFQHIASPEISTMKNKGFFRNISSKICLSGKRNKCNTTNEPKATVPNERSIRPLPRTSSVIFADTPSPVRNLHNRVASSGRNRPQSDHLNSSARPPSALSRVSRYVPRMQLFKQVFQHELMYTTLLTILFLVIAVIMLVGVSSRFILGPDGWIGVNWMIVSFFTMQSFSRVVRRHDREAILQHPSAWDPIYRAELEASRAFHQGNSRRPLSPISVVSRQQRRRDDTTSITRDPFQDHASMPRTDSVISYEPSPAPSISDRLYRPATNHWDSTIVLPSPATLSAYSIIDESDSDSQHIIIMRPTAIPGDLPSNTSRFSFPTNLSSSRHSFESRSQRELSEQYKDDGDTSNAT